MGSLSTALDALRAPAYTGRDRCLPCTVLNLSLVAVAAGLAASQAVAAGVVIVGVGVTAVWLRGYVVPETPRLTRRYLPDSVLAAFGKRPSDRGFASGADVAALDATDPTAALAELGVLRDDDPPALAPSFRETWANTAGELSDDAAALRAAAAETLAARPDAVTVSPADRGGVDLAVDGDWVGQWPSRAVLVADLATEHATRIRGVAARCPVCGAETRVSTDTVEPGCREADVVAVTCPDCAARLAEFEPSRDVFSPGR